MSDAFRWGPARMVPMVLLALTLSSVPHAVAAQATTVTVRAQENFRATPNGEVLGVLEPGTPLRVVSRRDRWIEAEAEGWMWIRSLQVARREGMDLVISEDGGENLRAEPSGRILARFERGTLLTEAERIPGWIRVRRRGWVWAPSTNAAAASAATPAPAPSGTAASASTPPASRPAAATSGARTTPGGPPSGGGATPAAGATGPFRAGPAGAPVLSSPDGDTLAVAGRGTELAVLAREGNWSRVRIEGWVWNPPAAAAAAAAPQGPPASAGPAQVAANPEAFRGRLVSWDLQFVSRERAEKVRTDFYEGEPFLLARHGDGPFVYVAVPPDRLPEVEGLVPLERISVVGRVRVASSDLTGSPILDLVELRRAPRR